MSSPRTLILALQCSMIAACGGPSGDTCVHDTDCASGFCKADGTCAAGTTDGGSNTPHPDGPAGSDADGSTGACTPNHDGSISADELPLIAGRSANFLVATGATTNTAGAAGSDGSRTWDLSGTLSGDQTTAIALTAPTGQYWASDFPDASYSTPLAAGSDVLGIFQVTDSAVLLLGIVSPASGGTTDISYSPPATILKLPFKAGDTWTSTSTVTGTLESIPSNYKETYTSRVDATGTMKTPYGTFPVLRVETTLDDLQASFNFNSTRTFAWVSECFGSVAKVTSKTATEGTSAGSGEITDAAEVDRLSP